MFSDLLASVKKLKFYESRAEAEDFLEFVYRTNDLKQLTVMLEAYFGPAVKPTGKDAGSKEKKIAEPYGGIMKNQTLYYHIKQNVAECAMLWPWQSGDLITVKIIQSESPS